VDNLYSGKSKCGLLTSRSIRPGVPGGVFRGIFFFFFFFGFLGIFFFFLWGGRIFCGGVVFFPSRVLGGGEFATDRARCDVEHGLSNNPTFSQKRTCHIFIWERGKHPDFGDRDRVPNAWRRKTKKKLVGNMAEFVVRKYVILGPMGRLKGDR